MKHNYKLMIVSIVSMATIIAIVIFAKTNYNFANDRNTEIDISNIDSERMVNTSTEFLKAYLNFSSETLQNGEWRNRVKEYIDEDGMLRKQQSELYTRYKNIEWQIAHITNEKTTSQLVSLDSIKAESDRVSNIEVSATLKQKRNGSEVVYSPYFNQIVTYETTYIIDFDNNYKIVSLIKDKEEAISDNWKYTNS